MSVVKALLRVSAFPILFAGSAVIAVFAYAPERVVWLMPALVLLSLVLAVGLERWIPYQPSWQPGDDVRQDFAYLGISSVSVQIGESLVWAFVAAVASWLPGFALLQIWPGQWPLLAQLVLALVVGDLLPYAYHRMSHESQAWLWRVHAIHHAPDRLHALNFARFHPLNALLTAALTLLPLLWLGASPELIFVAAVLHNVHGVLSHANVDFRLGPLNILFSMAELHRLHHARDPALANGNYGATVLIWDWLFGTRRTTSLPLAANAVGLWAGSSVPAGLWAQMGYPFQRLRQALSRPIQARRGWWRCCAH